MVCVLIYKRENGEYHLQFQSKFNRIQFCLKFSLVEFDDSKNIPNLFINNVSIFYDFANWHALNIHYILYSVLDIFWIFAVLLSTHNQFSKAVWSCIVLDKFSKASMGVTVYLQ
jgi:hypothetical protein